MDDKPIGLKQAAAALGLQVERARDLARAGAINAFRPGGPRGHYQVLPSEVERIRRETSTRRKE